MNFEKSRSFGVTRVIVLFIYMLLLQAPFRPPRPMEPEATVTASTYLDNLTTLLHQQVLYYFY